MKKLFLFITLVVFIITSCNKQRVSPTADMPDTAISKSTSQQVISKLIAGGGKYDENCSGTHVGKITLLDDGDSITVTYDVIISGWAIDETHLYIGPENDIPATKKGNPKIGHFEYKSEHDSGVTNFTHGPFSKQYSDYVIAAHAVVSYNTFGASETYCDDLPETVDFIFYNRGPLSYLNIEVSNGSWLDGPHPGWCVDVEDPIVDDILYSDAKVYCSTEPIPNGLIDHPENLDQVNWIINFVQVGMSSSCDGAYTYGDIQRAIWELVDDENVSVGLGEWSQCRADEIVANAMANGKGFEPECGDNFGVILDAGEDIQTVIISASIICGDNVEETAWGYGHSGEYCDTDGANGISFTDSPYYGGKRWGWYFYGVE